MAEYKFMEFIKDKKTPQKFVDRIQKEYNKLVMDEITNTIDRYQTGTNILSEAMDDSGEDGWLNVLVYSLINSSSAFTTFKTEIRNVLNPDEVGTWWRPFSDNTKLKLEYNTREVRNSSSVAITLGLEHTGPDAEKIARALNVALYGGEFRLEDDGKSVILNARPGYAEKNMEPAAEALRKHFINRFDKIGDSLVKELEDELKKFKE